MSTAEDRKYYRSHEWRKLRSVVMLRALGRCETPRCKNPARIVDHIVSRKAGGPDHEDNLRALCPQCDNRIKEDASGVRRGSGIVSGCDATGMPIDPKHHWHG